MGLSAARRDSKRSRDGDFSCRGVGAGRSGNADLSGRNDAGMCGRGMSGVGVQTGASS